MCFLFNGYVFQFISAQDESERAFTPENSILLLICCKAITKTVLWSPLTGLTKNLLCKQPPSFYKRKHDKASDGKMNFASVIYSSKRLINKIQA